jgi:uncharacterized protein
MLKFRTIKRYLDDQCPIYGYLQLQMELLGYISAVLIGLSLGLIGGGGSILTVPALVYLMRVSPVEATAYSLFIVGITSLVGGVQKFTQKQVHIKAAILFGIPSIIAVFLTRLYVVPALPDEMFTFGNTVFTKDHFIMLLFALLMALASWSMIREQKSVPNASQTEPADNYPIIFLEGLIVGTLTGFVGAGGGFLIIPALVLLRKMPMKIAVGTSLVIIAAKSLIGFLGDLSHMKMDWKLLIIFSLLAVSGIFAGNKISHKFDNAGLKKGFGWFVLAMSIYIVFRETT